MKTKLFLIFGILLFGIGLINSAYYVSNPTNCPSTDSVTYPGQDCSPNDICGDISGIAQCADTSLINPPSSSATSNTAYNSSLNGGYVVDCYRTTTCNYGYCNRNSTCYTTKLRDTTCTANQWIASTCGSCRTGYLDCSGDDICETQIGTTTYTQPHTTYLTCSSGQCSSGYVNCTNNLESGGCNEQIGVTTCTLGGVPGTYNSTCGCSPLSQQNFSTNTLATGYGSYLLWGNQTNTLGWLINLFNVNSWFHVDQNGNVSTSGNMSATYFIGSGKYLTDLSSLNEADPFWSDNFTKYNSSWTSTYNSTYNTWAYNQTTPAINTIVGFGYWNSTFATFNKTYADTLYATSANTFSYWNSTFAVFNKTYADTLYYGINNGFTYWNSTFATFNKTYADTLYATTGEPLAYNGSLRLTNNFTFNGQLNSTKDIWSAGVNLTAEPRAYNGTLAYNSSLTGYAYKNETLAYNGSLRLTNNFTFNGQLNSTKDIFSQGINLTAEPKAYNGTLMYAANWNATNTSYYLATNPFSFYNSSTWNNPYTYWNSTFATFNKTYADTLYATTSQLSNFYLNTTNQFSYYNSTTLPASTETFWNENFSLYNSSWASTYNSTYNTWAYNQTTPSVNTILGYGYYNSSNNFVWNNTYTYWNSTFAVFNKTYADTLYYGINNAFSYYNSTFATFNKTYADTLYATTGEPLAYNGSLRLTNNFTFNGQLNSTKDIFSQGINLTAEPKAYNGTLMYAANWNATNTSYYLATNPFSFYNSSTWNNPYTYWNSTFATFNKTYADTIYVPYTGASSNVALGAKNLTTTTGWIGIGIATPNNLIQVSNLINFDNSLQNTFIGYYNGVSTISPGTSNAALGYENLYNNTKGFGNAALGFENLYSNINGSENQGIGYQTLYSNIEGYNNVAVGYQTLYAVTSGYHNTAIGDDALFSLTTGFNNVALGSGAGFHVNGDNPVNEISDNSVYLGAYAEGLANYDTNEIVIGANAVGNGNNSVTLGDNNILNTYLKGNVGIGTTSDNGNKLQVTGNVSVIGNVSANNFIGSWNGSSDYRLNSNNTWLGEFQTYGAIRLMNNTPNNPQYLYTSGYTNHMMIDAKNVSINILSGGPILLGANTTVNGNLTATNFFGGTPYGYFNSTSFGNYNKVYLNTTNQFSYYNSTTADKIYTKQTIFNATSTSDTSQTYAGWGAGNSNTGVNDQCFGSDSCSLNSVDHVTCLGESTCSSNSGKNTIAIGWAAGNSNSGWYSLCLGEDSCTSNTVNYTFQVMMQPVNSSPLIQGNFGTLEVNTTGILNANGNSKVRYTRAVSQSIGTASYTVILWNDTTNGFDTNSEYSTSTGKFTAKNSGYYQVNANWMWNNTAWVNATIGDIFLYKNDVQYSSGFRNQIEANNTEYLDNVLSDVVYLNVGDYITIKAYQNSGVTKPNYGSGVYNYMTIMRLP